MGVTSTSKQINLERIDCDGTLQVTLALSASPDIVSNPTDIVLTLDRSDSLGGAPDAIGSGSRIGIVSFNQAATADTQLVTSVAARKDAADALDASGSTNHAAAFSAAMQLFDPQSANAKVIVLFTDGKTTAGPPPAPVAAAARAEGIILYCIGLIGSDGIDVSVLNDWAPIRTPRTWPSPRTPRTWRTCFATWRPTSPRPARRTSSSTRWSAPTSRSPAWSPPTKGTAEMQSSTALQWKIPELGVTANEGASLQFAIRHTDQKRIIRTASSVWGMRSDFFFLLKT